MDCERKLFIGEGIFTCQSDIDTPKDPGYFPCPGNRVVYFDGDITVYCRDCVRSEIPGEKELYECHENTDRSRLCDSSFKLDKTFCVPNKDLDAYELTKQIKGGE